MVGKKSARSLLREEGRSTPSANPQDRRLTASRPLEDGQQLGPDNMAPSKHDKSEELLYVCPTWRSPWRLNLQHAYSEYLKRDDQYLAWRTLQEENTNRMVREARDRDRALAQSNGVTMADPTAGLDEDEQMDEVNGTTGLHEPHGSKIVVIHPGSQNLRIGLANDALPKTVPMCVARKSRKNESEQDGAEPRPKRIKTSSDSPEKWFGEEFATQYNQMSSDLKIRMRNNKRRLLPNSKELVINYNKRVEPEIISEHNDPHRIDWTEIPLDAKKAPEYFTGLEALRIAEQSRPRYKLVWPLRHGWLNEKDYVQRNLMLNDFSAILDDAIKSQLGLKHRKELQQYSCVFVIPDLYERNYVIAVLDILIREFGFKRVCFMQESLAASFGAGYSMACIVDIGAQKTSICCVEDGMCIEESRMNLKYGGMDVTELFMKMMLFDYFPYSEINLMRRYDFLVAEELKQKFCSMNESDVTVQLWDFHLRASGQDTRKYTFKTYDETMLAPMGYFQPQIFDYEGKLDGRRRLLDRSYDLYDGSPNDPYSTSQSEALQYAGENISSAVNDSAPAPTDHITSTIMPGKEKPISLLARLHDLDSTPKSSVVGSPAPEGTPQPDRSGSPAPEGEETEKKPTNGTTIDPAAERVRAAEERDRILPVMPIDAAIYTAIRNGSRGDDRKMRDFFGGIMVVGGGAKIAGFNTFLETKLRELLPGYAKEILIGLPPRDLDQQLVVWKGGSVFGRLSSSGNDSWVYCREYEVLGAKLLAQKMMWPW